MEIITRQFEVNQTGRSFTDQFLMDEDFNVPDSKNDVKRIVMGEGRLKIDEMKPVENYLRIVGKVEFQILYVTDGIEPAFSSMEGKMPFEEMVYVEEGADDSFEIKNHRVDLKVSMVHSRKLRLKAVVSLELESERRKLQEVPTDVECDCKIYKKQENMELLKLHTSKKDTYRIKEEINLSGTKESIGVMLWSDITNRKLDTRLSVDELQIQGELLVFCFYESPDGKIDWVEQLIPYQGRVECYGVDANMYHHVQADLEDVHTDIRLDEDGEMRIIGIEGTLKLNIGVYEEEQMEVLKDLYSLEQDCHLETEEVEYEQLVLQNHSKCKVMERLSVPELQEDVLQICHSSGALQIEQMEMREDGILVTGILHVSFLYVKANDEMPFDIWQGMVPFSHLVECSQTGTDLKYHISGTLEQLNITLQGGDEIEVKAALAFHGFFRKEGKEDMIQQVRTEPISLAEVEKRPSIVGYIVKDGDELWTLAKRYSTSVEAIREMNDLAEGPLKAGDRLLIFKENMSIL